MESLRELNLSDNRLTAIPGSIGHLESLSSLELNVNQLQTLPGSIGDLKSLKTLSIWENQLTTLPDSIGDLESLTSINLDNNRLKTLPKSLSKLSNLIKMSIEDNPLDKAAFKILEQLEVKGVSIINEEYLAKQKAATGEEKVLKEEKGKKVIFHGELISVEERDALRDLEKAVHSKFSTSTRMSYPQCRFSAYNGNVTALAISLLGLKKLPESFGNLKSLKTLTLSYNKLKELPEAIGNMESLERLWIHGNQITTLPESMLKLTKLSSSDISIKTKDVPGNNPLDKASKKILRNMGKKTVEEEKPVTQDYQEEQITIKEKKVLENLEKLADKPIPHSPVPDRLYVLNFPEYTKRKYLIGFGFRTDRGHVEALGLNGQGLKVFPESILNLKWLKHLRIMDNHLTSLPPAFGDLELLDFLYLTNNEFTALPDSFGKLQLLLELDMRKNKLKTLPASIGNCISLRGLNLSSNELTTLPESIINLEMLKTLDLSNNKLTRLPKPIGNMQGLNKLQLGDNLLRELPESIGKLKNISYLNLDGNQLSVLPESFGNLKALLTLDLGSNRLTAIPGSILELKKIYKLELSKNHLTTLPKSLGNLVELESLNLDDNQISALPGSLLELSKLKTISIENNPLNKDSNKILRQLENKGTKILCAEYLKSTPRYQGKEIRIEEKKALEELEKLIKKHEDLECTIKNEQVISLSFSGKGLTAFPEKIPEFRSLESLDLGNNQITTIPDSIGNLKSLKYLKLQKNMLTTLPESIGKLESLCSLEISLNRLSTLPESISNLKSLKILSVGINELETLPDSIGKLRSIKELYLRGNKSLTLPKSLEKKKSVITGFYKEIFELPGKQLNLSFLKEILFWQERGRFSSSGIEPSVNISASCVGLWLWIKGRTTQKGRECSYTTDRLGGDEVSYYSGKDWVGLMESVPTNISRLEELDRWALYSTGHSYRYGDWAGDVNGCQVIDVGANGKVTIHSMFDYYMGKHKSEYTEYVQLK